MRKDLKKIGSQERHTYTGVFVRYGFKNGYKGPIETLLLKDIKDSAGNIISDHLWFNKTKGFAKYDLKKGDVLKFDARVSSYQKGYKGYDEWTRIERPVETDYKLSYPTKIELVKTNENENNQKEEVTL